MIQTEAQTRCWINFSEGKKMFINFKIFPQRWDNSLSRIISQRSVKWHIVRFCISLIHHQHKNQKMSNPHIMVKSVAYFSKHFCKYCLFKGREGFQNNRNSSAIMILKKNGLKSFRIRFINIRFNEGWQKLAGFRQTQQMRSILSSGSFAQLLQQKCH